MKHRKPAHLVGNEQAFVRLFEKYFVPLPFSNIEGGRDIVQELCVCVCVCVCVCLRKIHQSPNFRQETWNQSCYFWTVHS